MKKIMTIVAVLAVAGTAVADLAVNFLQSNILLNPGEVTPINSSKVVPVGALAQLVWRADNVPFQDGADIGLSLVEAGDIILATTASTLGGTRFNVATVVYSDADVGGADISSGYFFARLFETAAPVVGDYFVEVGINGTGVAGGLTPFSALVPTSTYADSVGAEYSNGTSIDIQGTTVIPEPATFGLMGLAGLGMFLARRKVRA